MNRDDAAEMLRARLEREPGVVAAWLYGSVARGDQGEESDVDVAVLFGVEPTPDEIFDLEAELARLLGVEVQVVDARGAPADLFHRVLRDGILLVDRDRGARIAFEVEARGRYFDMTPVWLEYRRARSGTR